MRVVLTILAVSCSLSFAACSTRESAISRPSEPVDTPPIAAPGNLPPEYPIAARYSGTEGVVELGVLISADGRVEKVELQRGDEPFASAALAAVQTWEFKPALRNGKPVSSLAILPVRFQLKPTRWMLVAIPADGSVEPDPSEYRWFNTETECERAAVEEKDLIVFGCLCELGAASTVLTRRNADQPPAGWSELILAPIGADMTPIVDAPEGDWLRLGTFRNQAFCEASRLTALEMNTKQPDHLAVRQLDAALLCLAPR